MPALLDELGQPILDEDGQPILDEDFDPWLPGDPWPAARGNHDPTPGGVALPAWGGYVRLWVLAEIAAGTTWKLGPGSDDRLDSGNCLTDAGTMAGGGTTPAGTLPTTRGLWVDLTAALTDLQTDHGSSQPAGIFSKPDAATLTASIYDPTGNLDPYNPNSPYSLNGRSRLGAGTNVLAFYELVVDPARNPPDVQRGYLFAGTTDHWAEDWRYEPSDRRAVLVASDFTKRLNKANAPEDTSQGAGETVFTRLNRILAHYGFGLPTQWGTGGTRTLAATTLAQSALELIQRAVDDELGYWSIQPTETGGSVIFIPREAWTYTTAVPRITVGADGWDIAIDAKPQQWDKDLVNLVNAANTGGTNQQAANQASIDRFGGGTPTTGGLGVYSIKRTDLGLNDDSQAADWAEYVVAEQAFPATTLESLTVRPAIAGQPLAWQDAFGVNFLFSLIGVNYHPPNFRYQVDTVVRCVGRSHHVTPNDWSVEWRTVSANIAAGTNHWTLGPNAFDQLDAGNVLI